MKQIRLTRKLISKDDINYDGRFVLKYFSFVIAEYSLYLCVIYTFCDINCNKLW